MVNPTTLLVSRDPSLIEAVHGVVNSINGFRLEVVSHVDEACNRIIEHEEVVVVLFHLGPETNVAGVTRLLQVNAIARPSVATIAISEQHHAEQALSLLRLGVADCLSRPLDLSRLAYLIEILTIGARYGTNRPPAPETAPPEVECLDAEVPFVYLSSCGRMGRMIEQIKRIAPLDTTILLGGETGTGKTRLAGAIHRLSSRRDKPFLAINCGALAANLIESEMFGHVRGAFTGADVDRTGKFAEVGRGTIFLDEIDALPPPLQAKLLRVVEDRAFEPVGSNKTLRMQARLIAASNRPLDQEVAAGRFRADLFYRLNVVAFELPPLRERRPIIPALARLFLAECAGQADRVLDGIADDALRALEAHSWPGNIRELRNVIERAVALSPGPVITIDDLPMAFHRFEPLPAPPARAPEIAPDYVLEAPQSLAESRAGTERTRIFEALHRNRNNRLRAAADLGVSRMTLYKKLHKYGLMNAV